MKKTILTLSAALSILMASSAPAIAQQMNAGQSAMQAQQNVEYSDAKLEAFVDTLIKITAIQQSVAPQMQSATTEEEKAAIIQNLESQIVQEIKQTNDMTVEEFEKMSMQAQQDQQMTNKIRMMLSQKMGQQ